MVTKRNKFYDREAYSTAYKAFILSNATTLTFNLEKNRVLPLMMVIKCTMLYDPGAYSLVSILPKGVFYQVMLWP
jgi:hypothetical protein